MFKIEYVECQVPCCATGVYLYGSVGSGKSLLMDMFFAAVEAEEAVPLRRRIHFNAAMLEVPFPTYCSSHFALNPRYELYLEVLLLCPNNYQVSGLGSYR